MPQAKKPAIPEVSVNSSTLAGVLNISQRRVQQLAKDGVIPAAIKYKYDLVGCVSGYVTFLQKTVAQKGSGASNADLKKARVALLQAQKRAADLIHKEKQAQLLPIDDVESMFLEAASIYAGQLNALGSRLSGRLASMTDSKQILKVLKKETNAIRAATAEKFSTLD